VVIEASRPRALQGLGLAPEMTPHRPGQVWLSITGYGRGKGHLVAFGHDAAVAGGLVGWADPAGAGGPRGPRGANGTAVKAEREPVFCADAVADPLTGVAGALAVARSIEAGGGELIDLPMSGVAACFAAAEIADHGEHEVRADGTVFCATLGVTQPILPPRSPERTWGRAAAPDAGNGAVLAWLGSRREVESRRALTERIGVSRRVGCRAPSGVSSDTPPEQRLQLQSQAFRWGGSIMANADGYAANRGITISIGVEAADWG
jgi:crotonobetainyl-CoA:carnitine CoA-transferase CaiB-like acyl-CoA transferase